MCKTKFLQAVRTTTDVSEDEGCAWFLGSVSEDRDQEDKWFTDLLINGVTVHFRIDTGADITVVTEHKYQSLPQRPLLCKTKAAFSSPGGELVCKGKFLTNCARNGQKYTFWIYVMSGPFISNLLGGDTATKMGLVMGLVHRVSGVETFEDVFGDIGLLDCDPVNTQQEVCPSPMRQRGVHKDHNVIRHSKGTS